MESKRLQKLFKALNPLSCEQVHARLSAWALEPHDAKQDETIEAFDAEEDEAIREHVLVCDECLLAFSEAVGRHVDAGVIKRRAWPSGLPVPSLALYKAYAASQTAQEVLGMVWETVQQAARERQQWAREQLAEGRRLLEGTIAFWQMMLGPAHLGAQGGLGPALGDENETQILAEVVDEQLQPQGQMVPFAIQTEATGPRITADGRFTMTLHTNEAHWQGAPALCTLQLVEGQRVSFASIVEPDPHGPGGQVQVRTEGLPATALTPVPLEFIELRLVAPNLEAP